MSTIIKLIALDGSEYNELSIIPNNGDNGYMDIVKSRITTEQAQRVRRHGGTIVIRAVPNGWQILGENIPSDLLTDIRASISSN